MMSHVLCFALLAIAASSTAQQSCNSGVECVVLETSCSGLYSRLQQGNTPVLTKLLRSLHCGFDESNRVKVCCPPEFQFQDQSSRIGGVYSTQPTYGDGAYYTAQPFESVGAGGAGLLPSNRVCGIQNNDRIVGGTKSDIDEHPWMALLRYDKPRDWGFYCGGVLISSKYVMTAAHCVKGKDLPTSWRLSQVRLGEWNTTSSRDCYGGDCSPTPQDVVIEQVIAHEDYDPNDDHQHNDIALLRLAHDVQYSDFVKPICLPLSDFLKTTTFDNYDMEVAGWGKTESRSESDVKLKVRVPVVTMSECQRVFRRVNRRIINKQMCAGGAAGHDSCRGDSGGPLMGRQPNVDNWIAAGIVSYGPSPCGTPGWPGVYTRVGAYVDWITSKLRP